MGATRPPLRFPEARGLRVDPLFIGREVLCRGVVPFVRGRMVGRVEPLLVSRVRVSLLPFAGRIDRVPENRVGVLSIGR